MCQAKALKFKLLGGALLLLAAGFSAIAYFGSSEAPSWTPRKETVRVASESKGILDLTRRARDAKSSPILFSTSTEPPAIYYASEAQELVQLNLNTNVERVLMKGRFNRIEQAGAEIVVSEYRPRFLFDSFVVRLVSSRGAGEGLLRMTEVASLRYDAASQHIWVGGGPAPYLQRFDLGQQRPTKVPLDFQPRGIPRVIDVKEDRVCITSWGLVSVFSTDAGVLIAEIETESYFAEAFFGHGPDEIIVNEQELGIVVHNIGENVRVRLESSADQTSIVYSESKDAILGLSEATPGMLAVWRRDESWRHCLVALPLEAKELVGSDDSSSILAVTEAEAIVLHLGLVTSCMVMPTE